MEREAAVVVATKLKEAMNKIDEALIYMSENAENKDRTPLVRVMGEIFVIASDKICSRLVKENPELHDFLFRGLPRETPDNLLRMSQLGDSNETKE